MLPKENFSEQRSTGILPADSRIISDRTVSYHEEKDALMLARMAYACRHALEPDPPRVHETYRLMGALHKACWLHESSAPPCAASLGAMQQCMSDDRQALTVSVTVLEMVCALAGLDPDHCAQVLTRWIIRTREIR